jgi:flagellar hook-associated protein 2
LSTGSFDLKVGSGTATTITIDSTNNTLSGLASTINNAGLGVAATVVTDTTGARLSIVARASGAANDLTISNDTTGLALTKSASGVDASLTVDGIPVTSATNTVSGVVPCVVFNLTGANSASQVTIGVSPDVSTIASAVKSFVNDYNTVMKELTAGFAIDTTTNTCGAFVGDSSASMAQQQMLDMPTFAVSGAGNFSSLYSLGITMANDGTLSVDSTKLSSAINSDFADFQNFFQGTSGFGTNFNTQLSQMTSYTEGAIYLDVNGIKASEKALNKQISDLETYLVTQKEIWTEQYNRANVILQQMAANVKKVEVQLGTFTSSTS